MKKGPYEVIDTKLIYKNPWIEVNEDKVINPDGSDGIFGTVEYIKGTSIVALDDKLNIYLVKEYYYVLNEYGIQLPSGGIEEGENNLEAAKKELLEEAGIRANNWRELGYLNPFTMIIKSPVFLFLATDLEFGEKSEKDIDLIKIPFEEAYQMVLDNKISHAQSIIAILKTKILLDKGEISV
jgi:8-oxo-dGTP pyrophosphatase MutT (NUDIX family)